MYRLLFLFLSSSCFAMESSLTKRSIQGQNEPLVVYMDRGDAIKAFHYLSCSQQSWDSNHPLEIDKKTHNLTLNQLTNALRTPKTRLEIEYEKLREKKGCQLCLQIAGAGCCCGCISGCMLTSLICALFF